MMDDEEYQTLTSKAINECIRLAFANRGSCGLFLSAHVHDQLSITQPGFRDALDGMNPEWFNHAGRTSVSFESEGLKGYVYFGCFDDASTMHAGSHLSFIVADCRGGLDPSLARWVRLVRATDAIERAVKIYGRPSVLDLWGDG